MLCCCFDLLEADDWKTTQRKYSDYYINQNIFIFNNLSCSEEHHIYSILNLPPAGIDLLISPVPAHLSRSSFRNQIRKANTAVVRLSDRHRAHSWRRRKALQLRPPPHAALKMENKLISGLISYFCKTSSVSPLSFSRIVSKHSLQTTQWSLNPCVLIKGDFNKHLKDQIR